MTLSRKGGTSHCHLATALITARVAAVSWHKEHVTVGEMRSQIVDGELQPIAALPKEDQALINELRSDSFSEKDSGSLESYLMKIRRDGVAEHADMKQRLDTLAENNAAVVTLIETYSPRAKIRAFVTEATSSVTMHRRGGTGGIR